MGHRRHGSLRVFLGFLVFVGFIGFLLVEIQASRGFRTGTATTTTTSPKGSFGPAADHPNLDLYYMSKRGVPNGPDPIHNRREGKFKQPPGRA